MVNCVLKYVVFCCCCCCFVIEEISSVVLYLISHNYSIFLLGTLEGKENRKGYREIQVEIVSCLTLCDPMDCIVHGILLARILEWVRFPSPGDLPNPGIKPRCPTLWVDSLPAEPQGKPKNTGVGSLFLLQWIFQTQELNQGLLHYKWILYQLSYDIY